MSTAIPKFVDRRTALLDELRSSPSGREWCERHTDLVDDVVKAAFAGLESEAPQFAVVATGGYGRRELAPWSDVDLTFVPLDEGDPGLEKAIKSLYRALHDLVADGLGMKLGYALRFASDCPGLDAKTRSGLLDARLVVGSKKAHDALTRAFWDSFPVAPFIIDKIEELRASESKTNDTPLATQPDLKRGAGGLRAFQTANWIGAAIGERMTPPSEAYRALLLYRNMLHLAAGKPFEQLTHSKREEVSSMLGMEPLEFGSKLAEALCSVADDSSRSIERIYDARFQLAPFVESHRGEARIDPRATAGQAALGIANATRLGLRISDVKARPTGTAKASEALFAISCGERTLRQLDRSGVLEALLPELTDCRTLMPRDRAHDFTVFEHSLRVVRNLDSLPADSFLSSVAGDLRDRAPLYLAALLHDVGRIKDEATHAELGAEVAARVCERWDVYESTKETVCWLVQEHLLIDRTLRMRDVQNPETAHELAAKVGSTERLALLSLLTWADVNAVNSQAWTSAQETLLRELYTRTVVALASEEPPTTDTTVYRRRLAEMQKGLDVPKAEFEAFLDAMPAHYLLSTEPALARSHFHLVASARKGEVSIVLNDAPELGATDVTVCCPDATGLLSRILGVTYAFDLGISGIRAATTDDETPVALDTITVSFGGRPIPHATASRLSKTLSQVVKGELSVDDLLRSTKKDPDRTQDVLTYQYLPGDTAIIEIQAPRGRGMAYRLSRQLSRHGINILGARVGQWAGSGTAAFYVEGRDLDPKAVALALQTRQV